MTVQGLQSKKLTLFATINLYTKDEPVSVGGLGIYSNFTLMCAIATTIPAPRRDCAF
ncbi:hypothetical protein SAMN04488032_104131 [Pacificibacter marinus]|uniref:Uncharacterized protein n=1 Tax=Pacificibacter marinus TaxID=658057 RepID=A0A1Y5SIZ1_9RHOB|nr:hypothetical protein SAMN04488032_104131 [Pacificibacter marinus]SLN41751.1 hypothetical protein PAM7971_01947 [Pacificibacter marinus]